MDLAFADTIITLRVDNFVSVTQGVMVTSGASPDVVSALTLPHARVTRISNHAFEVKGGTSDGNPLSVRIEILPREQFDAVGLFIRKLSNVPVVGIDWDDYRVGNSNYSNAVTVRDRCVVSGGVPVTYEVYLVIKRKAAGAGFPLGDLGLIDPKISNL